MEEHTICLQCGNRGFTNAFVYCVRCLNFAVHRYCLPVIPETLDEFVRWYCDDCEAIVLSQIPVHEHVVRPSHIRFCQVPKKIKVLSENEKEINDIPTVQTHACEHVHKVGHEQSSDERERSQQSPSSQGRVEEKVEEDLTRKRKRVSGTTKKKRMWTHIKRKRQRKSIVIELATKEDQCKLDRRERKDPTPKKKRKTKWTPRTRTRVRERNPIKSAPLKANQHKPGKTPPEQSCEERIKADPKRSERLVTDSTLPSEVRENNGSMEREKTSDSDTDPGTVEHPVISCKEEKASEILQRNDICGDYPKELDFVAAEPIVEPIWRGSFDILNEKWDKLDELMAHISSKACLKVYETAFQFKPMLQFEMLPKSEIWPKSFDMSEPSGNNIALYFFPSKISEQDFDHLVEQMMSRELGLKAVVQNAELLIFTSTELPLRYWRFCGKYYLWGVFRGKQKPLSQSHSS